MQKIGRQSSIKGVAISTVRDQANIPRRLNKTETFPEEVKPYTIARSSIVHLAAIAIGPWADEIITRVTGKVFRGGDRGREHMPQRGPGCVLGIVLAGVVPGTGFVERQVDPALAIYTVQDHEVGLAPDKTEAKRVRSYNRAKGFLALRICRSDLLIGGSK